jgi:hypothetical protein
MEQKNTNQIIKIASKETNSKINISDNLKLFKNLE